MSYNSEKKRERTENSQLKVIKDEVMILAMLAFTRLIVSSYLIDHFKTTGFNVDS